MTTFSPNVPADQPFESEDARMTTKDIVEQELRIDPARRFEVVDEILHRLGQPDPAIDAIWLDEAERRLAAYRAGNVRGMPADDVLGPL